MEVEGPRAYIIAFSLFLYKYWTKKSKPRPKLGRREIKGEAKKLYSQMYTAFAE